MKIKKAVIPVAGLGTRFLPITKSIPKEMLPVIDKPVIQYVVEEAVKAGINEIIFVISPEKKAIKDYFKRYPKLEKCLQNDKKFDLLDKIKKITKGLKFSYVEQLDQLGTGHALLCAKRLVGKDNFAYFDGDAIIDSKIPAIKQVMKVFDKYKCDGAIGGMLVERKNVTRYGNLDVSRINDNEYQLKGIIEKPPLELAPKYNLVITGQRYVFKPKIFDYLETQKPGVKGEIWLADSADRLAKKGGFYACHMQGKYHDTGNKLEYLKTNIDFAMKRPELKEGLKKYLKSLEI